MVLSAVMHSAVEDVLILVTMSSEVICRGGLLDFERRLDQSPGQDHGQNLTFSKLTALDSPTGRTNTPETDSAAIKRLTNEV